MGLTLIRSSSQSLLRAKHGRQPSPPITTVSSQAEAPTVFPIQSANLFDPFSDDNNASPPPSPTLSKPTGKLARRRQQQQRSASPSPPAVSKAIPVPQSNTQRAVPTSHIARSDPLPSNIRPRPVPKRSSTFQDFPICDDMNEKSTKVSAQPPSTPPRRPTTNFVGPHTAPLSAIPSAGFPFDSATPPTMKRGTRKHQRVPSEGMFGMSSDEDVSTGAGGVILNPNVQALFGLVNSGYNKRSSLPSTPTPARVTITTPVRSSGPPPFGQLSREQELEREALEKAGYYASSMFQNSPSPEELPDPLLLWGVSLFIFCLLVTLVIFREDLEVSFSSLWMAEYSFFSQLLGILFLECLFCHPSPHHPLHKPPSIVYRCSSRHISLAC